MKIVQIRWFHLRSYECLCTDKFDTCLEACECTLGDNVILPNYILCTIIMHSLLQKNNNSEMAQSKRNKMNHIFIHAIKYCNKQHTHRNNAQYMSPID